MAPSIGTRQAVLESKVNDIHKTLVGNGQPGLIQKFDTFLEEYSIHRSEDASWKGRKDGSINTMKYLFGATATIFTVAISIIAMII